CLLYSIAYTYILSAISICIEATLGIEIGIESRDDVFAHAGLVRYRSHHPVQLDIFLVFVNSDRLPHPVIHLLGDLGKAIELNGRYHGTAVVGQVHGTSTGTE